MGFQGDGSLRGKATVRSPLEIDPALNLTRWILANRKAEHDIDVSRLGLAKKRGHLG
ncbi:hypothetical protein Thiowin_00612 [Thiorhodovibrio winogradskyi]|uniref:Uncharacterized protein n=1 Tax=Thiorhodovibrio winogradskyi TaxID=77007 RepID=A0ABZ0S3M8_9GAMM